MVILRLTSRAMIAQLDKLSPPEVLPISMADVDRLVTAGRLAPFSAKSNGVHMLAWRDSSGLLFMCMARLGTSWSVAQVELLPTDTVNDLSEAELFDDNIITLLSNLTSGSISSDANCSVSWASPKVGHEHFGQALQEAETLGARADGVIALLDGSCLQPCKVKAASCHLEWDSCHCYLTSHRGFAAPPSCEVMAEVAADNMPSCPSSDHGAVYEVDMSAKSVQLQPDRVVGNLLAAIRRVGASRSISSYRPGGLRGCSGERSPVAAIRASSRELISRWLASLPRKVASIDMASSSAPSSTGTSRKQL